MGEVPRTTWMTNDMRAFVGELLMDMGTRTEQYEIQAGQSPLTWHK